MIDSILKVFPSPDGGIDIDTALRTIIGTHINDMAPLSVVGLIGRGSLKYLSLLLPVPCTTLITEGIKCHQTQCSIYAMYHQALSTVYLVLVSSISEGALYEPDSFSRAHEDILDATDSMTEATFLLFTTCQYIYLTDDVPRLDIALVKLVKRISDIKKSLASYLNAAADSSVTGAGTVVTSVSGRGGSSSRNTDVEGKKSVAKLAPGKVTPTVCVILPECGSRSSSQFVNGIKSVLGNMSDVFSLDTVLPVVLVPSKDIEASCGDSMLYASAFDSIINDEGTNSSEKKEDDVMGSTREHLVQVLTQLHSETSWVSKVGSGSRRRDGSAIDVIPSSGGWIKGFITLVKGLKEAKVGSILRNCRRSNDAKGRWSAARVEAFLPQAITVYKSNLPDKKLINTKQHEQALSVALNHLSHHAGRLGPRFHDGVSSLESAVYEIWSSGLQACDEVSLLGNECKLASHRKDVSHHTGVTWRCSCMCGSSLVKLDDDLFVSSFNGDSEEPISSSSNKENIYLMISTFNSAILDAKECSCVSSTLLDTSLEGFWVADIAPAGTKLSQNIISGEGLLEGRRKLSTWKLSSNNYRDEENEAKSLDSSISKVEITTLKIVESVSTNQASDWISNAKDPVPDTNVRGTGNKGVKNTTDITEWPELNAAGGPKVSVNSTIVHDTDEDVKKGKAKKRHESHNKISDSECKELLVGVEYCCRYGHRFLVDIESAGDMRSWPSSDLSLFLQCSEDHKGISNKQVVLAQVSRIHIITPPVSSNITLELSLEVQFAPSSSNGPAVENFQFPFALFPSDRLVVIGLPRVYLDGNGAPIMQYTTNRPFLASIRANFLSYS